MLSFNLINWLIYLVDGGWETRACRTLPSPASLRAIGEVAHHKQFSPAGLDSAAYPVEEEGRKVPSFPHDSFSRGLEPLRAERAQSGKGKGLHQKVEYWGSSLYWKTLRLTCSWRYSWISSKLVRQNLKSYWGSASWGIKNQAETLLYPIPKGLRCWKMHL